MLGKSIILFVSLLLTPCLVSGDVSLAGKVISVQDGDTLTIVDEELKEHKIRINGIDAPESDQPYGKVSKENMIELSYGRIAALECHKADRYGRSVCTVWIEGVDVGLSQLRMGLAWHYKKYQDEQAPEQRQSYSDAEINAKKGMLGLWIRENSIAPWEWRKIKKGNL